MGDGVGETLMLHDFATAVRHRTAPDQDVHFGVELSVTGIQAMRSSLAATCPSRSLICATAASAEPTQLTTGIPSCQSSSSQRSHRSRPQRRLGGRPTG
jgi:hypothetical protein